MKFSLLLLLSSSALCRARPGFIPTRPRQCGLPSCHPTVPSRINVHLVPHSHDDTGWLKTVDQYYYGANSTIQRAGVQYILDSVVKELARDPDKKFIQVNAEE